MSTLALALTAAELLLAAPAPQDTADFVQTVACPLGTHPGYMGRYCWPNRRRVCHPGFHLSHDGRHCWRNR